MIDLFTLEEAKARIHITARHSDGDLQLMVLQATAILLNYIKVPLEASADDSPTTLPWMHEDFMGGHPSEGPAPFDIQAAAMLIFGELANAREASTCNPLSPAVVALLARYRDGAMA